MELDGSDERIVNVYHTGGGVSGLLAESGENFNLVALNGHRWAGPIETEMSDLEWTTEKPTKLGWYRFRRVMGDMIVEAQCVQFARRFHLNCKVTSYT